MSFSPDGKRVAFLRGGKLLTMDPDGKDVKVVVGETQVFDYEWSPDSKWLAYARRDGSFASELYIVPAGGATAANPARNVTRYATYNGGVTWSADGKRLAFLSERRGGANLHYPRPRKAGPAPALGPPSRRRQLGLGRQGPTIDWDDIHLRAKAVVRGCRRRGGHLARRPKVAFRDAVNHDLWVATHVRRPADRG